MPEEAIPFSPRGLGSPSGATNNRLEKPKADPCFLYREEEQEESVKKRFSGV
jgi:hypothetical protein